MLSLPEYRKVPEFDTYELQDNFGNIVEIKAMTGMTGKLKVLLSIIHNKGRKEELTASYN